MSYDIFNATSGNGTIQLPPDWDPFTQSFTLLLPDGTPFNVSMADLDYYRMLALRQSINWAAQLGASLIMLTIVLLVTRPEKRKSPIFILNVLALILNTVRSLLQCLYFTGPWYYPYAYFAGDYSRVPQSAYSTSYTAGALTLAVLICLEISLVLQVRVVCVTMHQFWRYGVTLLSAVVALVAIAFRFVLTIINAEAISGAQDFLRWAWLASANNITTTISICFFCAIFVAKLGWALWQRKKLGLRQFGPMQIIFIMGCQTLVVPAIFSILQYIDAVPDFASLVITITALFLPLSSIWASASIGDKSIAVARGGQNGHRRFFNSGYHDSRSSNSQHSTHTGTTYTSATGKSSTPLSNPGPMSRVVDELGSREIRIEKSFDVSVSDRQC